MLLCFWRSKWEWLFKTTMALHWELCSHWKIILLQSFFWQPHASGPYQCEEGSGACCMAQRYPILDVPKATPLKQKHTSPGGPVIWRGVRHPPHAIKWDRWTDLDHFPLKPQSRWGTFGHFHCADARFGHPSKRIGVRIKNKARGQILMSKWGRIPEN